MSGYLKECTPGYYNAEGKAGRGQGFFEGHFPGGPVQFYASLEAWRAQGEMQGLTIK